MFDPKALMRAEPGESTPVERSSRRVFLRDAAMLALAAAPLSSYAQHGTSGLITPPVRLEDTLLVDQTGTERSLNSMLLDGVTAVQTIYTGCSSVCPLQGALFSAVQQRLQQTRGRYPVRLLSIGIDPLSDSPSALHEWLKRFQAGPAWTAATPTLRDVDGMRMALAGSRLPLGNIADHATQIYCFDASARLRWRSADLPRVDEICNALGALGRA